MKHQVIRQWVEEKAGTIQEACRLLGVSRSGLYAARRRAGQPQAVCGTRVRLRHMFEANGQCYGSRRLRKALATEGIELGRYRVRRLMKELQLKPIWKPKFVHTTDSHHALPVYENVLDRQFEQREANRAWVSDITYIQHAERLAVSRCGAGSVFAKNRRLGHGAQHAGGIGLHRLADCHCPAKASAGPDRTLRSGQSIRQSRIPGATGAPWLARQYEP